LVTYNDGRGLLVAVYTDYHWAIGFTNLPLRFPINVSATFSFDKVGPYQFTGTAVPDCIQKNAAELVPYSTENAEVLAQVLLTKCADLQSHYVDLGMALYNSSRPDVEKAVNNALET
jgi:hypothetical protein